MNTQTQIKSNTVLNRMQAQWLADWLRTQGTILPSGWTAIWRMTPEKVAQKYGVKLAEVIAAAAGEKR